MLNSKSRKCCWCWFVLYLFNNRASQAEYRAGVTNLWHVERFTWHAAFTAFPNLFFCPTSIPILWRICTYIHTSECVQTVCELPLLPNNSAVKHIYTNRDRCEVLTGYLSLGCRCGGDWANTWHWTKRFTVFFHTGSFGSPSDFHVFFLIAFLEEAFIIM